MPVYGSVSKSGNIVNINITDFGKSNIGKVYKEIKNSDGSISISSILQIFNNPPNLENWLKGLELTKFLKENLSASYTYKIKTIIGVPNGMTIDTSESGNNNVNNERKGDIPILKSIKIAPKHFYNINISTSPYVDSITISTTTLEEEISRGFKWKEEIRNRIKGSSNCPTGEVTITKDFGTKEKIKLTRSEYIKRSFRPKYLYVGKVDFSEVTTCKSMPENVIDCISKDFTGSVSIIRGQGCSVFGISNISANLLIYEPLL